MQGKSSKMNELKGLLKLKYLEVVRITMFFYSLNNCELSYPCSKPIHIYYSKCLLNSKFHGTKQINVADFRCSQSMEQILDRIF